MGGDSGRWRGCKRTKKTPLGSGVFTRVIVVVANPVSVSAAPWWFLVVFLVVRCFYFCLLFFFLYASSGFDVWFQMSNTATAGRNLFCAQWNQGKTHAIPINPPGKQGVADLSWFTAGSVGAVL
ncbi:MAG: hypothetical protein IT485_11115 [Gammaproteobacteria bacterium]|nr:hypothetical protein [Gammaproteobacteria bacterium]